MMPPPCAAAAGPGVGPQGVSEPQKSQSLAAADMLSAAFGAKGCPAPFGTQRDMHVPASFGRLGGDHPGDNLKGVEPLQTPKKGPDPLHPFVTEVQFGLFGNQSGH